MSFDSDSHDCIDDTGDSSSLLRKDSLSFGENNRYLPLGSGGNTLATSHLDTVQLFPEMETKLYKRRWLMLFIFSIYSMSNSFMWLQYSIISNIFRHFYSVDRQAIDWLSMIYLLTYVPLILPVTWMLEKRGMKDIVLVGSALNCIGAWIKTSTADPAMYAITFLGQFVCSVAAVFLLGLPSKLASLWFGKQEVSTACSIGVLGNQVCLSGRMLKNTLVGCVLNLSSYDMLTQ